MWQEEGSKWALGRATSWLARAAWLLAIVALVAAVPAVQAGWHADDEDDDEDGPCSRTADAVFKACRAEITDDFWIEIAKCINGEETVAGRRSCKAEAREDRSDGLEECEEQFEAREDFCDDVGQDRYIPEFEAPDFETVFDNQNPYWPLKIGNKWVFEGSDETITVEVLGETKLIEGVTCIVVNDVVEVEGQPIEDTDDWYAQATNGDVWYVGEISQDFELFPGDMPPVAELVEIEGSWKTGRDDALPGIVMFASPEEGTIYRQEVSLGNAEDAAEVVSDSYRFGDDPDLDDLVPEDLADLLCDGDCVVIREFTPITPGVEALKYYSPLVGLFLEVEDGEVVRLNECNVDSGVCAAIAGL